MLLVAAAGALGVLALVVGTKPAEAAFPGDNGRIMFTSDQDGDFEIYSMKPDGTDVKQITSNTDQDYLPAWSPDGTKIAFERREGQEIGAPSDSALR